MRATLVLAIAAAAVAGVALAPTAGASSCTASGTPSTCSLSTTASVTVGAGSLSLDVTSAGSTIGLAGSSTTSAILPGAPVTGDLGTTTVNDTRGTSTGWTVSVAGTNFSDGAGHSIPVGNATVTPGTVAGAAALPSTCGTLGLLTFPAQTITLSTSAATVATCGPTAVGGTVGSNSAQWTNKLSLTVPTNAVAGTYTGSVTQSVQ